MNASANHAESGPAAQTIIREDKGLHMSFRGDRVVKDYSNIPTGGNICRQDQTRRFENEIAAYRRFNELGAPFVPKLIACSEAERTLTIERVPGTSLLDASARRPLLPIASIVRQLNAMNRWLREHDFPDMGNNVKDLVLSPSGKLYLVDFETYTPHGEQAPRLKPDLYTTVLDDLAERILVRRERTARLTPGFLLLAAILFLQRPRSSLHRIVRMIRQRTSRH